MAADLFISHAGPYTVSYGSLRDAAGSQQFKVDTQTRKRALACYIEPILAFNRESGQILSKYI